MLSRSLSAASAVAFFAAASLWAPAASAMTFTTSSVVVTDSSISTDLSYSSVGLNNNIVLGTPLTISNFITATVNTVSNSDKSGTISAAFTFTDPTAASNSDTGVITGSFAGASSNLKSIIVTWDVAVDPLVITFLDGTKLQINLADTTYDCPSPSCASGNSFNIAGTFTLLNGPTVSQTPLPAAFPLFAGGLGVLGLFARSKKRKAA